MNAYMRRNSRELLGEINLFPAVGRGRRTTHVDLLHLISALSSNLAERMGTIDFPHSGSDEKDQKQRGRGEVYACRRHCCSQNGFQAIARFRRNRDEGTVLKYISPLTMAFRNLNATHRCVVVYNKSEEH